MKVNGKEGDWTCYWLMNSYRNDNSYFSFVDGDGKIHYAFSEYYYSVRPVFCLLR